MSVDTLQKTVPSKLLVLNVVGLSPKHIGPFTPNLEKLAKHGGVTHIQSMLPAVTCSVQATYFSGHTPSEHGIVGNGWYFKDLAEIKFWHQSNHLIQRPQIWQNFKDLYPEAHTANIFCWYNMYNPADTSVTVRPMYPADGRKIPDIYTSPPELRNDLNARLGQFPLFSFWGPNSNIQSSQWIADCALEVLEKERPDLAMVYLPHLDYALQKLGPNHPGIAAELSAIDQVCGQLLDYAQSQQYRIVVLSEYGIQSVSKVCYLNRIFRMQGWLQAREELGLEILDAGASRVFAVADHQIAHVYVQDKGLLDKVRKALEDCPEVELILGDEQKKHYGLAHERSGDLIAVSRQDAWFSYYYWLEDAKAPDFARTVDIHRKPGYDPVELFLDPSLRFPKLKLASKLLLKKLGFRTLMDVIPLDTSLVKGSHGAFCENADDGAIFICSESGFLPSEMVENGILPTDIQVLLLKLSACSSTP